MNTIGIITYDKYGRMIYRILNCSYTFIFFPPLCALVYFHVHYA